VMTSHSMNEVPMILISPNPAKLANGRLADIAPTMLHLMKLNVPKEMTGANLLI